jgi:hypothetical protein
MEGFSFVTPVTGLNRPNTGKKDDDDENLLKKNLFAEYIRVSWQEMMMMMICVNLKYIPDDGV